MPLEVGVKTENVFAVFLETIVFNHHFLPLCFVLDKTDFFSDQANEAGLVRRLESIRIRFIRSFVVRFQFRC